jgi:DNA-binding NtrC family response regulator
MEGVGAMAGILIVDDEEAHARPLAPFLDRRGYGATVAINSAQARAGSRRSGPTSYSWTSAWVTRTASTSCTNRGGPIPICRSS